jgi:cobalt-zinc-cadmium efflux system protein
LRKGAKESLNVKGAFLEVVSDALGSLGVIIAAVIMWKTGWYYADPIFGVLIGLFILPRTWKFLAQAVNILLARGYPRVHKGARCGAGNTKGGWSHGCSRPPRLDDYLRHGRAECPIVLADSCAPKDADSVLERVTAQLKDKFGIDHSTIQIERSSRHQQERQH